jgi:murein DD-endopeptidase MepM/ murein hydrolase activator NlpD
MAVSLLAGLARAGATAGRAAATGARSAARSGAKKLTTKKVKSFAKDKTKEKAKEKLSKKSILSKENKTDERITISKTSGEEKLSTSTETSKKIEIEKSSSSKSQSEQLKINVTNIYEFLLKSNNQYAKTKSKNKRLKKRQESKRKLGREENKLEKRTSPIDKSSKNIEKSIAPAISIFDRLFKFIGLIVGGIIINALPAIIDKVKEIIDNIVNFLTPIQSGFNLIMGFFTGEIDDSKLDADKKRLDDGLEGVSGKDGLLDKIAEKLGPFGGLVKLLKPAINSMRQALGAKKTVLAKKDGKEGVLNKETNVFTERQFTSKERRRTNTQNGGGGEPTVNTPDNTTTTTTPTKLKAGHYYFPLPKGRFAGADAQYYGAGRSYGGHAGIDLTEQPPFGSKPNIDVVALTGGTVIGDEYLAGKEYLSGMMIKGEDGYDQRYLHMTPMVKIGDSVKAGQKIGELVDLGLVPGYTTNNTHLHFEVYNRGKKGHLSPHKIYPQFFKDPNTAPKSFEASGGNKIAPVKKSNNFEKIFNSEMSQNTSTYYYIQPIDTVQYQVIPFPILMKKSSNTSAKQFELNSIWTE